MAEESKEIKCSLCGGKGFVTRAASRGRYGYSQRMCICKNKQWQKKQQESEERGYTFKSGKKDWIA